MNMEKTGCPCLEKWALIWGPRSYVMTMKTPADMRNEEAEVLSLP